MCGHVPVMSDDREGVQTGCVTYVRSKITDSDASLFRFGALLISMAHAATNFDLAAKATNELGVDLHRQLATGDENLCISPYSIDSALAMTFAGADGETRTQMARVLHFPNGGDVPAWFSALQQSLEQMSAKTAELVKDSKKFGGPSEPITL